MNESKQVARIFVEPTGRYHVCSNDLPYLDARGAGHRTKAAAMRAAYGAGYTHATGSGTYWGNAVRRLPDSQ